jgi:hypothetical protein
MKKIALGNFQGTLLDRKALRTIVGGYCPEVGVPEVEYCHNGCWEGEDNYKYQTCYTCCTGRFCGWHCA